MPKKLQKETKILLFRGKMASKQPISQLIMCKKGTVRHVLLTQPKFIPNSTQAVAILQPYSSVRLEAGMSMARSSLKAGKRVFRK